MLMMIAPIAAMPPTTPPTIVPVILALSELGDGVDTIVALVEVVLLPVG